MLCPLGCVCKCATCSSLAGVAFAAHEGTKRGNCTHQNQGHLQSLLLCFALALSWEQTLAKKCVFWKNR